ncbi:MAG TPA: hypothetical protein VIH78_09385 [Terriglobales bacterium]
MKPQIVLMVISVILICSPVVQPQESLTIDHFMTADELKSTGVSTLSQAQRKELDRWLTRYTFLLLEEKKHMGGCDPVIETQIDGAFHGWDGETVYKLRNGQIWQQASYHYHYHYAYAPEVTIYPTTTGCAMRVSDDDDEAISVRRIK